MHEYAFKAQYLIHSLIIIDWASLFSLCWELFKDYYIIDHKTEDLKHYFIFICKKEILLYSILSNRGIGSYNKSTFKVNLSQNHVT